MKIKDKALPKVTTNITHNKNPYNEIDFSKIYIFGAAREELDHHQLRPHVGWIQPIPLFNRGLMDDIEWAMVSKGGYSHLAIDDRGRV